MSEQVKIAYEKHPVTAERKAKLIKDGFKILDIRFKPETESKGGKKGGKKDDDADEAAKLAEAEALAKKEAEEAELKALLEAEEAAKLANNGSE